MKRISSFFAAAFCVIAMTTAASAVTCTSTGSTAWGTTGTWSCGHVPLPADDVVIATTHAVTYNPGNTTILSLTINGTGSLRFNDNSSDTLTVTGSVTNNGTIFGGDGPGNRTHSLAVGGNFTNNGTLTAVIGDDIFNVTMNGSAAQVIGGSAATAFEGLTINNAAGVTLNTTTNVGGSVTGLLTLTTDLTIDVANSEILIQSGTSAGAGDVLGTVRRTDVGATTRAFGNPNVQITNGGSATVDVNLAKGVPGGFAAAVARGYSIIPASGTGAGATVRLRYLQGELNGNTEAGLTLWRATGSPSGTWLNQGFTTRDATNNWVQLTGVTGFSAWTLAASPSAPTAVKLTSFNAIQNHGEVMLQWRTGYEAHNLGYVVYREQNGRRTAITPSLIAGSALLAGRNTQLTSGLSYTWYDQIAEVRDQRSEGRGQKSSQQSAISKPQSTVTYWLEDVDLNGTRTLHGPIAPMPVVAPLPAQGGKSGKLQRAGLIGELSLKAIAGARIGSQRTQVSGVEFRSWAKGFGAFAEQQAAQRVASGAQAGGTPRAQAGVQQSALTLGKGGKGRKPKVSELDAGAVQRQIESQPGIKLAVNKEGWYRVTQPELVAAGYDPNTNAPQLQLYANGRTVPIKQSGDQVHLTASDYIEFYGHGLESPTETAQTYYLVVDPNQFGTRIGDLIYRDPQPLPPPSGANSFDYTVERRERMIYFSSLRNGDTENFFGQVVSTTPTLETMPVSNLDPAVDGTLEVVLQGVTAGAHLVQVSLNGTELGTINFTDTEHASVQFSVPAAALQSGNNAVQLTSLGGAADVSLVDVVRLTYGHSYAADNNALGVSVDTAETKRIAGFTSGQIRVLDITDPARVRELTETVQVNQQAGGTYSVDVQVQDASLRQPHSLFVFTDNAALPVASVKHNDASSWWSQTAGADYLMITTRELRASLEPLAQLRRNQGQVVHVIDVEDIYDEFSFGQHTPQAIHDLLETAQNTWVRKPHFVLLAGDASYDPKNYFGQGANDLVPTKLIDTALMEAASDDWLADFNDDGLAELALGRLPVRSAADLNLMVGKIISYENAAPDPSRGALLVADTSFEAPSSAVGSLLPAGMAVTTVNRGSMNDAAARAQILAGLNQGPRVANYFGHGSNGVWTGASLLSSDDAPGLTNSNRLSVYTMMTCFNGFFQDAWNDSLSEALLKSQGGAVAVWASTTLTDPSGQNVIDLEFYRQVFGAQPATLGDASRAAKGTTGDPDVRRTWTLFGDPAMRVR